LQFGNVLSLRAFLSLDDFELYVVTFLKALVAIGLDRAVVNEDIRAVITAYETEALCVVKPFHFTFNSRHVLTPLAWAHDRAAHPQPSFFSFWDFATA
jgi:hypothetical protein